jgi:hypothetical protein
MGLDFLTKFLAQFIDKFKASSPVLFVIIAALLTAVKYTLGAGVFPVDPKYLEWVLWAISLVLGSRTTSFLTKTNQ